MILIALRDGDEYAIDWLLFAQNSLLWMEIDFLFGHVLAVYQYLCDSVLVEVVELLTLAELVFEGFVLDAHEIILDEVCHQIGVALLCDQH